MREYLILRHKFFSDPDITDEELLRLGELQKQADKFSKVQEWKKRNHRYWKGG